MGHPMRTAFFISGLLISTLSVANPASCGDAVVNITFGKSSKFPDAVEAVLTASVGNRSTVLRYDGNVDFIGAECRRTNKGKLLVVFQAFCGGSSCKDLDNFGIINPEDLRILLAPSDSSRAEANKIFGSEVAPIANPLSVAKAYKKLFQQ
jgi:hypothetical protein